MPATKVSELSTVYPHVAFSLRVSFPGRAVLVQLAVAMKIKLD